ncbi:MurR/RpiR family transcriptional regulator [Microbacterium halophytorum]|uniref:MurR/RpiR family transcriptional regulator n=1 Tax=Microbacterium halophytorum TaxID=2067568 RepID=UPI000CFD5A8D|nr:MurR/RpiR family transcriptional regulator [Microbacterium halophytorum]
MSIARPALGVVARVRTAQSSLGPSEARVADVIVERPDDVVGWSTAELAAAAETSTATVIRACQSVGFRGFQHLRLELARSAPMAPRDEADAVPNTFDDAIEAVRLAQECVDPDQIDSVAGAIDAAGRVVLVSNGFSGPPLQDFAMRLSTLGRCVEAPVDALAQQFAAHTLGHGDLCLALSYSGANVQTLRACQAAADRGATVAVITSYSRSPIGRLAALVVATGPAGEAHDVDPFLARLGHTVVLHALHSALEPRAGVVEMRGVVTDALTEE